MLEEPAPIEIKGKCFGVRLDSVYYDGIHHVMLNFMVEDDGIWHDKLEINSYWYPEMKEVLEKVGEELNKLPDHIDENGKKWGKIF